MYFAPITIENYVHGEWSVFGYSTPSVPDNKARKSIQRLDRNVKTFSQ
jgi:hypothetical protein